MKISRFVFKIFFISLLTLQYAHSMNAYLPIGKKDHEIYMKNNSLGLLGISMGTAIYCSEQEIFGPAIAVCGGLCLANNYFLRKKNPIGFYNRLIANKREVNKRKK